MTGYEGEIVTLEGIDGSFFDAVRKGYELIVNSPRPGETIFKTLGEYAVHQPPGELWQLLPAEQSFDVQKFDEPAYYGRWATAETLRTSAGEGMFLSDQMDLIEVTLVQSQRVTNQGNELIIASEGELRSLLHDYHVPTDQWGTSNTHDLYRYLEHSEKSNTENVTLHSVAGELWLATAQTMLIVYHKAPDGSTQKLRETWKTHYDTQGNPQPPVKSTIRSSIGETGRVIDGRPERPFDTARRGLYEELGIEDDSEILQIISTDSLLRLKPRGHHRFGPIKAEDHTHYFTAWLNPQTVRPEYINEERDASGRLHTKIKLEWFAELAESPA